MTTPHDIAEVNRQRGMAIGNAAGIAAQLAAVSAASLESADPLEVWKIYFPQVAEIVLAVQAEHAVKAEFPGTTEVAQPAPAQPSNVIQHPAAAPAPVAQVAPAPVAQAAAPPAVPGATSTGGIPADWADFFANPTGYYDNRFSKKSPGGPDFKSKTTGKGLWINGKYPTPEPVLAELRRLGYLQ